MKSFKMLPRLFAILGLVMIFTVSGWGADQCGSVTDSHTFTESSPDNYYDNNYSSNNFDNGDNRYFYFSVPVSGTLTFHNTLIASVQYAYDLNGCISSATTLNDGDTIHLTSDRDFNLRLHASAKNQHYNFNFTFVADQAPPSISVPNLTATRGTAFTASLATYVTLTNGDPLVAPYYTLTGKLPAGLTFNSTTGTFSGTPTTEGSSSLSVAVTDNDGISTASAFTLTVGAPIISNNGHRAFNLRKQLYTKGNMKTIGNTVMVLPTNGENCSTYTNGTYDATALTTTANGDVDLCAYSVDGNQTNATTAELALPSGAKVLWAGLYWQGIMPTAINTNMRVNIRRNNSAYTVVAPDALDYNDEGYTYSGNNGINYSAFADVTSLFGDGKWNEGNYTVSGVPVIEGGAGTGLGTYGAWTLVAIYEDAGDSFRSFSVFDGWQKVTSSNDAIIDVTGFYTPNRTGISAKVSVFAAEGDRPYVGDQLVTKNYNTGVPVYLETMTNNAFNSSITGGGARTPNPNNNFGIDIQTFDIGNLLQPSQTSMRFTFTSNQDVYFPSMIAFATELYEPQLCYDYSIKQDGRYLAVDRSAYPIAQLDSSISSSPLDILVYLKNKEADILAEGISLKADVNDSRFDFGVSANTTGHLYTSNINGSALIDRGLPASTDPLCAYDENGNNAVTNNGCTNGHDIRKGNGTLGSEQYVYTKFTLQPKQINAIFGDVNESLGLTLDYYITAAGNKIPYHGYTLGGANVPLCPPSNGYNPTWGLFNVVQQGAVQNNLKTQISRKPFAVDVIFDGTPTTGTNDAPSSPVNSTVLVEMIDVDSFGDVNASCANPDAGVSEPIYVPISFAAASAPAYQTTVASQNSAYYNFALKNGAFRIWYFTDSSGVLRNWSPTGLSNANKSITGISTGLFDSASHGDCNASCAPNGSVASQSMACFTCMKENYAKPLCSRDNFSVRPEAFDIRLKDFDNAGISTDLSHDVYGTAPDKNSSTTPATLPRMNLAAGYDYKYDLTATGHETDATLGLVSVPRYTRYFNSANSVTQADYNVSMYWEPHMGQVTTGCNDTLGRSMQFFLVNGAKVDQQEHLDQVGDYRLNMIDTSWTAVDQVNHIATANNGFAAGTDCIGGSTSTSASIAPYGCIISSQHTNGPLQYRDQVLTFKPAQFDLATFVHGLGKNATAVPVAGGFVYDANLSNPDDMNMSVRSTGQIRATGFNGSALSNFVKECYATDLNISVETNASLGLVTPYVSRTIYNDLAGHLVGDTNKTNVKNLTSSYIATLDDSNFTKVDNGAVESIVRLNFDRNITTPLDLQVVRYYDLNVTCALASDCNQSSTRVDINRLNSGIAQGMSSMNFTVTHGYGHYVPTNVKVYGNSGFNELSYMEVYNPLNQQINGTNLTPSRFSSGWSINSQHTGTNLGIARIGVLETSGGSNGANINATIASGNATYPMVGQNPPYRARAHVDTEGWLWYGTGLGVYTDPVAGNTVVNCLNHPCFMIDVLPVMGLAGSAEANADKSNKTSNSTNETGWRSTSEYAPAIR